MEKTNVNDIEITVVQELHMSLKFCFVRIANLQGNLLFPNR